ARAQLRAELFSEVAVLGLETARELRHFLEEKSILERDGSLSGEDSESFEFLGEQFPSGEHREHSQDLAGEIQGGPGEGPQVLAPDPVLVRDARIAERVIGQDGLTRLCDPTNLQRAERDTPMGAVEAFGEACAGDEVKAHRPVPALRSQAAGRAEVP